MRDEYQSREAIKKRLGPRQTAAATTWVSAGPSNGAGRINSLAVPSNPNIPYILAAVRGGGTIVSHVFKSPDAAESWHDLTGFSGSTDFGTSHLLGGQAAHDNTIIRFAC